MNNPTSYVVARWGGSEESPPPDRLRELIAELEVRDEEHSDTWMIHEDSGWALRLDEDRFAYLENPECETIKYMADVSSETALGLGNRFAAGGPDAVAEFEWKPGRRPVSEQERAETAERARQSLLMLDRDFYDRWGRNCLILPAVHKVAHMGAFNTAGFCKAHHFEQLRGRPCPFLSTSR